MKNQLLRLIAVAIVASLVLISWMKSREEAKASYDSSNKVERRDAQVNSAAQLSFYSPVNKAEC
tara:strand:- start:39876 stop:40067 length:192 start_codon:yes stop_codon:yes gene_type:complete